MRIKKLKIGFEKLTKEKARLIGHLIGDGCVYQHKTDYNIKYEVIDHDLLNQFEEDLIFVYGLKPEFGYNPSGKTKKSIPYFRLRSKLAFEDLKNYCDFFSDKWTVPLQILKANDEIKIEFLKALFDDEGSVIPQGKNTEVRLYSINSDGLKQIQELLMQFNLNGKITSGYGSKRNVYALILKNVRLFASKVNFNSIRKKTKLNNLLS